MFTKKNIFAVAITATVATTAFAADAAPTHTTLTAGAGVAMVPEYMGAKKMTARPVLSLDYQHESGLFASSARGFGYTTKLGPLSVAGALGYDAGRSDQKESVRSGSDALKGMGKIKGAALANLSAAYDLGSVQLSVGTSQALSNRERGSTYQFGASMPLLQSNEDQISVAANATYGDKKNVQTFYGVTAAQAAASGYKVHTAKAGFEHVGLGLNWNHVVNKEWSVQSTAGVAHLLGDAGSSPLTARKNSPMLMVTANYKFF